VHNVHPPPSAHINISLKSSLKHSTGQHSGEQEVKKSKTWRFEGSVCRGEEPVVEPGGFYPFILICIVFWDFGGLFVYPYSFPVYL